LRCFLTFSVQLLATSFSKTFGGRALACDLGTPEALTPSEQEQSRASALLQWGLLVTGARAALQFLWDHAGPLYQRTHLMLRIRGTVGDLPVDLTVEMDESDWARLGSHLGIQVQDPVPQGDVSAKPAASRNDAVWDIAQDLLRKAGQMTGPDLLGQLEGLSGSTAAGKRLMVRMRHSASVKVESQGDTPVYHWIE
jgi:hypothetical protein